MVAFLGRPRGRFGNAGSSSCLSATRRPRRRVTRSLSDESRASRTYCQTARSDRGRILKCADSPAANCRKVGATPSITFVSGESGSSQRVIRSSRSLTWAPVLKGCDLFFLRIQLPSIRRNGGDVTPYSRFISSLNRKVTSDTFCQLT